MSGRTITYTKGDNTTGTITTQDTNTDTKVTQSAIKSSDYTNWRPIIWGSSNSASEGFTPTTVTDGVFSDPNLTYQPSSGTLRATVFKGKLSGTADAANSVAWGNVSGKPSTFTPSSHTHTKSQITDFPSSLPASDVYSWAKAKTKPSYAWSEITSKPSTFTPSSHTHTKSQITDFPASLKNPTSVVIKLNGGTTEGTNMFTYDGSAAKSINITPSSIGSYKVYRGDFNQHDVYYCLGTAYLTQSGSYLLIKVASGNGYNSELSQDLQYEIHLRTGNGNPSGYAGYVEYHLYMPDNNVYVVEKSPTEYQIWIGKVNYSGKSFFTVEVPDDNKWINSGATSATVPTNAKKLTQVQIAHKSDIPTTLPASDVYSWAKASSKPSYSWNEISSKPSTFTPSSHTHNYAGSGSAGGSANSAVKLDTSAGSATQPVYFSGGKPVACTYTLAKSVPSNAAFTDTWRPLGTTANSACAGNDSRLSNARPASDVYAWAKASTKPSYSWSEIGSKPSTFTPSAHNHDTVYLKLNGGTMTGTLSFKNTGLQIISNLPEDFSGTPRGDRQVLWYSREFEDDSYKYEDYCTHYINLGTPNSGSGNGKFGANVTLRFYSNSSRYYTNIACNSLKNNVAISLPTNSGTLQVSSSDAKLKTNIKDTEVNDAISFINKIHLHSFDWKTDDTHQPIGFIADELEELDERLSVGGNSDKVDENGLPIDPKCVNTFYLQGYEVKAIQELSNKVDTLEKENNELKSRLTKLENK